MVGDGGTMAVCVAVRAATVSRDRESHFIRAVHIAGGREECSDDPIPARGSE